MPISFVKDTHSYANNRLFKLFSGGFSFPVIPVSDLYSC